MGYGLPEDSIPRYATAYDIEIQHWVDSVARGDDPDPRLANAWDGLLSTRSANLMVRAMENGDGAFIPVDVPETPEPYRTPTSH